MADGYLEKHYADYEARKAAWQRGGRRVQASHQQRSGQCFHALQHHPQIDRPEDEAL
jgi:hypothetical protein